MATVGDDEYRQDTATNEHEIMNKIGHATGPFLDGLCERDERINRCGGGNVGEALTTQAGDKDTLCLRGSGPRRNLAKRKVGRSRKDRGRRTGGKVSSSVELPHSQGGIAHNTVAEGLHAAPEADVPAANKRDAAHGIPENRAVPEPPRVPNPNFSRSPFRVRNPNFGPEPPCLPQPTLLQPRQPVTSRLSSPGVSTPSTVSEDISQYIADDKIPIRPTNGFWNTHFPWNFLRYADLVPYDLEFWWRLQHQSRSGRIPGWLEHLTTQLDSSSHDFLLRLQEVSTYAIQEWIQRGGAAQQVQRRPVLYLALKRGQQRLPSAGQAIRPLREQVLLRGLGRL